MRICGRNKGLLAVENGRIIALIIIVPANLSSYKVNDHDPCKFRVGMFVEGGVRQERDLGIAKIEFKKIECGADF